MNDKQAGAIGCLAAALIAAIAGTWFGLSSFHSASDSQSGDSPLGAASSAALHGSVSLGDDTVTITNADSFAWSAPTFTLRSGAFQSWDLTTADIPAGSTITLRLADFTDNGARFDPAARKPQSLLVKASVNGREAIAGWEWK